jgi:hypothetical protein
VAGEKAHIEKSHFMEENNVILGTDIGYLWGGYIKQIREGRGKKCQIDN